MYNKLYKLQLEIGIISKDVTNPFYKSKYFDINSLIGQLQPLLKKHGLLLLQPILDNKVYSIIREINGEGYVDSYINLPDISDPQKLGSAITYFRRYTLQSLLALQAEDDDGNKAIVKQKSSLRFKTPEFYNAQKGPYEQHKEVMSSVVYHFYNQFKQHGMLKLFRGSHGYDDGEQRRDFVYVKDTIDIKLWFMENNYSGIFNVATGKSRSFNDVANAVINYFNSGHIEYINFPEGLEAQYQAFTEADMSGLKDRGYQKKATELEDGVSSYLNFLDQN